MRKGLRVGLAALPSRASPGRSPPGGARERGSGQGVRVGAQGQMLNITATLVVGAGPRVASWEILYGRFHVLRTHAVYVRSLASFSFPISSRLEIYAICIAFTRMLLFRMSLSQIWRLGKLANGTSDSFGTIKLWHWQAHQKGLFIFINMKIVGWGSLFCKCHEDLAGHSTSNGMQSFTAHFCHTGRWFPVSK